MFSKLAEELDSEKFKEALKRFQKIFNMGSNEKLVNCKFDYFLKTIKINNYDLIIIYFLKIMLVVLPKIEFHVKVGCI